MTKADGNRDIKVGEETFTEWGRYCHLSMALSVARRQREDGRRMGALNISHPFCRREREKSFGEDLEVYVVYVPKMAPWHISGRK